MPRAPSAKSATRPAKAAAARKAPSRRKARPDPGSVGLSATECATGTPTAAIGALAGQIATAGGAVLATYREPLGGHWVILAALPLDKIAPTPYQRELSKTHADRLATVMPKVGRFLDPVIAVPSGDGFITPNGMHRLAALSQLGARAVVALVLPEVELAFRILALNTEKAHTLRDKALEVIRMARAIAGDPRRGDESEADRAFELELPAYVTLGVCYERNGRFSGGAYQSVVARCEAFATSTMAKSLAMREAHADQLLELDAAVTEAVARLKAAGFTSGYLKPIVVARINPLRFAKAATDEARPDFTKTIAKMIAGARAFDAAKVRAQDVAIAAAVGGATDD
jgi:ParB family chromosome partitioning protein